MRSRRWYRPSCWALRTRASVAVRGHHFQGAHRPTAGRPCHRRRFGAIYEQESPRPTTGSRNTAMHATSLRPLLWAAAAALILVGSTTTVLGCTKDAESRGGGLPPAPAESAKPAAKDPEAAKPGA